MSERTAFVLGGGGLLGAVEVGMLHALFEHGERIEQGERHGGSLTSAAP